MSALPSLYYNDRQLAIESVHAQTAIYTVDAIIDQILDQIYWPNGDAKLLEPSCGPGNFLVRAVLRLLRNPNVTQPQDVISVVSGWEIHPGAARESRDRIAAVLVDHGSSQHASTATAEAVVAPLDFLTQGPLDHERYGILIGNPPALRRASVPQLLQDEYDNVVPPHALNDLLHAFLDRCMSLLKPVGRAVLITPDRWLLNSSAASLRRTIGTIVALDSVARLDASTAFHRDKIRRAGTPPRVHPVLVSLRPIAYGGRPITEHPIYPGIAAEPDPSLTLGQVAKIRLAPWLGPHGIFTVDRSTADRLPSASLVPLVDCEDILPDGSLRPTTRYAIKTKRGVEPAPRVLEHLRAEIGRVPARGRANAVHWLPPEPLGEFPLSVPCLLIPRVATYLRVVRLPAGVAPVNHGITIISASDTHSLDDIERAFTSPRVQRWVAERAPRIDDGYLDLRTSFIRSIPIDRLARNG